MTCVKGVTKFINSKFKNKNINIYKHKCEMQKVLKDLNKYKKTLHNKIISLI